MILELERKTGAGIGALATRVFAKQFSQTDIVETIRLALVGGGMEAKRAAELVATYADRPLNENCALAAKILERRLFGTPNEKNNG
jgi:hypothetical protein